MMWHEGHSVNKYFLCFCYVQGLYHPYWTLAAGCLGKPRAEEVGGWLMGRVGVAYRFWNPLIPHYE